MSLQVHNTAGPLQQVLQEIGLRQRQVRGGWLLLLHHLTNPTKPHTARASAICMHVLQAK
jgi:hypothetical protein